MKHLPLNLLLLFSISSMLTQAQEIKETESLLQAITLVLADDGVFDAIARKHPKVMQGCERYGALRMDFLPNDKRFKNELVTLDSCLFGAEPNVLFFENIHELVALTDYKTRRSAFILKFNVTGPSNSTAHTTITSKVKRHNEGLRLEKVNIKSKNHGDHPR